MLTGSQSWSWQLESWTLFEFLQGEAAAQLDDYDPKGHLNTVDFFVWFQWSPNVRFMFNDRYLKLDENSWKLSNSFSTYWNYPIVIWLFAMETCAKQNGSREHQTYGAMNHIHAESIWDNYIIMFIMKLNP